MENVIKCMKNMDQRMKARYKNIEKRPDTLRK